MGVVGVGRVNNPAPSFTKPRLLPTIAPPKFVFELRFIVRVLPVANVNVGVPEIVVPFKEILLAVLFELVVVRFAFRLSVLPYRVIGPLILVAVLMVRSAAFPDLPRVRPVSVLGMERFVGANELVKEVATGLMVSVPVLVSMEGLTSKVM